MRIGYMGTPDFAVKPLEALCEAGHDVALVVTQPDAVRDRGKKVKKTPVKETAERLGIDVIQPERLRREPDAVQRIRDTAPDVIAVAAFGQILPKEILDIPQKGCLNVHGSLLPRFRGASPIQRAVLEGDEETGVTIMYMAEELDAGDMLAKASTPVAEKTAGELHDELSAMGASLLVETLSKLDEIVPEKQDEALVTYAPLISKEDGHMDFSYDPAYLGRMIRAFDPWPGTYAYMGEKRIKIWKAEPAEGDAGADAGTVVKIDEEGIYISAGGGLLKVTEIQMPGKKRVAAAEYLKGNSIEIGTVLR